MAIYGRQSLLKIYNGIREHKAFTAGNVSGVVNGYGTGRLPEEWRAFYANQQATDKIKFTIYSYATPIAWVDVDGTWYLPDVKYSQSTTGQQSAVHRYLADPVRKVPADYLTLQ